MTAGLLLVAAALGDRLADRFLVGDLRRLRRRLQPKPPTQSLNGDLEMGFAATRYQRLLGFGIQGDLEGLILLGQLGQSRRQPHIVLAVLGGDGHRIKRRDADDRYRATAGLAVHRQYLTSARRLQLGDPDHVAGMGLVDLTGAEPRDRQQPAGTGLLAGFGGQFVAVGQLPAHDPRISDLARLAGERGLEDIAARTVELHPSSGDQDVGRFVPQRFQQPPNAKAVQGRAEEHRHDQTAVEVGNEVGEHRIAAWIEVREQLLHQVIVEVGQLLEHVEARVGLLRRQIAHQVYLLRGLARPIDEGPFQGEVYETSDLILLDQWDLARHQRRSGGLRQGRHEFVKAAARLVDAVDEDRMRDTAILQRLQDRLQ